MNETTTTILIVGAGPTGLTLACELARKGVPFRIIEAAQQPQAGSRGKGVQPRTLEVLDDLGVVDRVLAHGRLAMPIQMTGPDGVTRDVDAVAFRDRPDIPYPASLITPEWRMEEALRERLTELGGSVEFGAALIRFDQDERAVSATIMRDGVEEVIAAHWLVGADGGHSVVRKQLGIAFDGETLESVRMIVADVSVDGLDREAWRMWRHEEGMAMLCPLPSTDLFQFQASIAPGQDAELTIQNLQAILDSRSGRSDITMTAPAWTSLWRANIRLVESYRSGRAFLAGDAAHIHSPAGGQGMNTGIQDAHNLGWKLAAVESGAPEGLLDSYEAERRPVAESVLALSNERLRRTLEEKNLPVRGDANTMQLTIGYRSGPLAVDDREEQAPVRAGDRVPDVLGLVTTDGEWRLFDLLRGGRFTLLRFGDAVAATAPTSIRVLDVVPVAHRRSGDATDVVDGDGALASTFGVEGSALVLLRPDGYIGAISDAGDISVIESYLALVGPPTAGGASDDEVERNLHGMDVLDFEGWDSEDWDGVFADHHTDDVVVDWKGVGTTRGLQAHQAAMKDYVAQAGEFPRISEHPIRFGQGEWTCVVGVVDGATMVTVAKWRDGKIAEEYIWG